MSKDLTRKLFLASESPRRAEILKKFKIPFQVIPNKVEAENNHKAWQSISAWVRNLAYKKANQSKKDYQGLILGVDTVVVINKKILGKPPNIFEAKKYLKLLSGKTHYVMSGFCLIDTIANKKYTRIEKTIVEFNKLRDSDINDYCMNFKVIDKAGAYAIQECPDHFIAKIEGSFYNVMGLPIDSLLKIL